MPEADSLTVTLPADASRALRQAVTDGEYGSIDDALADALAAWGNRHEERADDLAWIKAKIRTSLADPDPDLSVEEVEERLRLMFEKAEHRADEAA